MKVLLIGAVTAATLALPVAALAATYQYVNTQGVLVSETADNATQALTQPTDIALHSGVMLVTNTIVVTNPAPQSNTVTGTYSDVLTGINTPARTMYLTLNPDGTIILSSIYNNPTPLMIESGTWTGIGNNQVQVTLTGNQNGPYSQSQVLVFNQNGTTSLVGSSFSSGVYGTQGLTFVR